MVISRDRSANQSKLGENLDEGLVVTTTRAASLGLVPEYLYHTKERESLFALCSLLSLSLFPVGSHYP